MSTGPRTSARTALDGDRRVLELPQLRLQVLSGDQRGQEFVVDQPRVAIGKSRTNDVVLTDQTVSRVHCEIVREQRGFILRDLGSTNGALFDGAEIREVFLKPGGVVTVGKVELKIGSFHARIEILPSESSRFGDAVGQSVKMREIFGLLERVAPSDATVLLGGETGTGKDVLARAIHAASPRKGKPFVIVDCGAVVANLIESELFGHERGSFTGAVAAREGAFELADGGTVFLDEIGELPLDLQPKLLRVLETKTFRRVGSNSERRSNVRVVAASKRNIKAEVERGKFREDLYFRLAVVPVDVPPLRERRDDLPMLVAALLEDLARREPDLQGMRVDDIYVSALATHDWPGNVRELRNVLARAAYLAQATGETTLGAGVGPFGGLGQSSPGASMIPTFEPNVTYRDTKARFEELFEKKYIAWLLERNGGNISAAAREAGMDRKHLTKLATKHEIHPRIKTTGH